MTRDELQRIQEMEDYVISLAIKMAAGEDIPEAHFNSHMDLMFYKTRVAMSGRSIFNQTA